MRHHHRVATVSRDGLTESVHAADVVVVAPEGDAVVLSGEGGRLIYPRSALKPFQAIAALRMLARHGLAPDDEQIAIGCSSHAGGDDHQIEAAGLLAEAGLDESALRCPAVWPIDEAVRRDLDAPTRLSHDCSGKHALLLWAHVATGADPARYLEPDAEVHRLSRVELAAHIAGDVGPPGVDGCGAPAFTISPIDLARAYARLLDADGVPGAVREAMRRHPHLVGGSVLPDTKLMWSDVRVLAKRGAEGVMAGAFTHRTHGALGIAVKIHDGGDRAAGPVMAAVLEALGANVPPGLRRVAVMARGEVHGEIAATPGLSEATTRAFGLT